jgi:hypothetical protein
LDGTKIKANASKHKAMSYERMKKREAELKAEVAGMLAAAEALPAAWSVDEQEVCFTVRDAMGPCLCLIRGRARSARGGQLLTRTRRGPADVEEDEIFDA